MRVYRPNFLNSADQPWIERVLELYKALRGHFTSEIDVRWSKETGNSIERAKYRQLRIFLDRELSQTIEPKRSRAARMEVFERLYSEVELPSPVRLQEMVESIATQSMNIDVADLKNILVSDLLGERVISNFDLNLSANELALMANLWHAKSLIMDASVVRIVVKGQVRRVIQIAKLKGLICTFQSQSGESSRIDQCKIEISGPAAILFRTKLYGSSFASLLSVLPWCDHFELEATCHKKSRDYLLCLKSGDPIKPTQAPKLFDSKIEQNFSRTFAREFKDWQIVREPGPIQTRLGLIFPDFMIYHKTFSERSFLCEIVGWWTKDYLTKKIAAWESVDGTRYLLCVDECLGDYVNAAQANGKIVFFKKKISAASVMERAKSLYGWREGSSHEFANHSKGSADRFENAQESMS